MPVKVVSSFYLLPETQRRIRAATKAAWDSSPKGGSNWMQTQFAMAVFHLPVRKRSHIQMQRAVLSKHMQTIVAGRLKWKT